METLYNGYTLDIPEGAFPLSTDSIALADFVRLPKQAKVLDLCSGCGTLGVLLCAADSGCTVTGVEIDPASHEGALKNIADNALSSRMYSICDDVAGISRHFKPGSFDVCVCNPPYFSAGPQSKAVPFARREDHCSLNTLLESAGWALRYGGDLFLVHRPERLGEICAIAANHNMQAKRISLLRHTPQSSISLILLQLRKGGKPGLIWEETLLHNTDGTPTADYCRLYHI